jgi:predicted ATPase
VVCAREAVALGRRVAYLFSLAQALFFETVLHWYRRDVTSLRERAAEVIRLSEAHGFPVWLAAGRAFDAAARVADHQHGAVAEVMNGLTGVAQTGVQMGAPALLLLLAQAQQAAGRLADAQSTLDTALAVAAQTGQPFVDAELHRVRGELVLTASGATDDALACFDRALAIARDQVRSRSSSAPRRTARGCSAAAASAPRRTRCSRPCSGASPKGSTRRTSSWHARCSTR